QTGNFQCSFPDGPASPHVTISFTDSDTATGNTADQLVSVANVAPTVTFTSAPASANEGQTKTYTYSISDPGVDTITSVATSCGGDDGNSNASNTTNAGTSDTSSADPNARSITSALADDDDTFPDRPNAHTVHVNNVAPSITISGAASVNEGSTYSLTLGAVSDPGTDTVSGYIVHWGDGNSDSYTRNGAKTHTYADGPSSQAVTVDLDDGSGNLL